MARYVPLTPEFFHRSAVIVGRDLIGKYLMRRIDGQTIALQITETESYEGLDDMASHAYRKKGKTARNAVMFGPPGTIYVYFTYGMHWMLNIVCGPVDHPAAVLIRGVEGVIGPARLTKYLHIDKMLNVKRLGKITGLWIANNDDSKDDSLLSSRTSNKPNQLKIIKTPRIGIAYAGPVWSKKLYRFVLESGTKENKKIKKTKKGL
jgi:DNA-3-methyladenine glycosylase